MTVEPTVAKKAGMSDVTVSLLVYCSLLFFLAFLVMFSQGFALMILEEILSLKYVLLQKVIYCMFHQITNPSIC